MIETPMETGAPVLNVGTGKNHPVMDMAAAATKNRRPEIQRHPPSAKINPHFVGVQFPVKKLEARRAG